MTAPSTKHTGRSNIFVEEGTDPSRVIIAFTGLHGGLNVPVFDFLSATGTSSASRILLRDPLHLLYLAGCWPDEFGFYRLVRRLRREIHSLGARQVTCVGTSSGGYAAIIFGHVLKANRVHAFAPTHYGSAWIPVFKGDWKHVRTRVRVRHLLTDAIMPPWLWKYRNLGKLLAEWNGVTDFTVHVCGNNQHDVERIEALRGRPQVEIATLPCSTHQVAKYLVRSGQLAEIFES
jgi:hypothetical protein